MQQLPVERLEAARRTPRIWNGSALGSVVVHEPGMEHLVRVGQVMLILTTSDELDTTRLLSSVDIGTIPSPAARTGPIYSAPGPPNVEVHPLPVAVQRRHIPQLDQGVILVRGSRYQSPSPLGSARPSGGRLQKLRHSGSPLTSRGRVWLLECAPALVAVRSFVRLGAAP